jgi:hypothetical protein
MRILHFILLYVVAIIFPAVVEAQPAGAQIDAKEQKEVIESVSRLLNDNYIFPEVAKQMGELLQENLNKGVYASIANGPDFSKKLTDDLRSVSKDKHLTVKFNPQQAKQLKEQLANPGTEPPASYLEGMRMNNFGFREVKLLDGNIGYLKLDGFVDANAGGETAIAAMNFLSNASALIIDLRNNGGGSPSMIQLLTSYLYGPEPVHLNSFYHRPKNEYSETWTLKEVSGRRRPDIPVYILTSGKTFSAAEEFTYNLKNLKRATIVGETTGGGAHPGGTRVATERFTVWVPTGRAINPITKTNWEGTGVAPDITTKAADALLAAHTKALEGLVATSAGAAKARYEWELLSIQSKKEPLQLDSAKLQHFTGTYGDKKVTLEDGQLYFFPFPGTKVKLIPLTNELFELDAMKNVRLQILSENNTVTGIAEVFDNGQTEKHIKKA